MYVCSPTSHLSTRKHRHTHTHTYRRASPHYRATRLHDVRISGWGPCLCAYMEVGSRSFLLMSAHMCLHICVRMCVCVVCVSTGPLRTTCRPRVFASCSSQWPTPAPSMQPVHASLHTQAVCQDQVCATCNAYTCHYSPTQQAQGKPTNTNTS